MSSMLAILSPRNSFKSHYAGLLTRTDNLSHFQIRFLSDIALKFLRGRNVDEENPEEIYCLDFEEESEALIDYLASHGILLAEDHLLRLLKKDGMYVEDKGVSQIHLSYSYYKALIMHIITDVKPDYFVKKIKDMQKSQESLLLLDATTEQEFSEFSDEQILVLLPVQKMDDGWDLLQNSFTLPKVYKELYIENVADVCWRHFLDNHQSDLTDDFMFYLGNLDFPALGREKWTYLLINHDCDTERLFVALSQVI